MLPFLIPLLMAAGGAGIGALTNKHNRLKGALTGAGIGATAGAALPALGAAGAGAAAGTAGTAAAASTAGSAAGAAATGGKFAQMMSKLAPYAKQYAATKLGQIASGQAGGQDYGASQTDGMMPISTGGGALPSIQNVQAQQTPNAAFQPSGYLGYDFNSGNNAFTNYLMRRRFQ